MNLLCFVHGDSLLRLLVFFSYFFSFFLVSFFLFALFNFPPIYFFILFFSTSSCPSSSLCLFLFPSLFFYLYLSFSTFCDQINRREPVDVEAGRHLIRVKNLPEEHSLLVKNNRWKRVDIITLTSRMRERLMEMGRCGKGDMEQKIDLWLTIIFISWMKLFKIISFYLSLSSLIFAFLIFSHLISFRLLFTFLKLILFHLYDFKLIFSMLGSWLSYLALSIYSTLYSCQYSSPLSNH